MSRSRNYQKTRFSWPWIFTASREADVLRWEIVDGLLEREDVDHGPSRLDYAGTGHLHLVEALRRHQRRWRKWSPHQALRRTRRRTQVALDALRETDAWRHILMGINDGEAV